MNIQYPIWETAQMLPCEIVIMSKVILFWRTLFSLETIQCPIRTALLAVIQVLLGKFSKGYKVLQANWGNRDGSQMIIPVGNRTCSPDLEARKVGSFRDLTWWHVLYLLAIHGEGALSDIRSWWDKPDQNPYILPSFNDMCSILGVMYFSRCSLQQNNGIQVKIE